MPREHSNTDPLATDKHRHAWRPTQQGTHGVTTTAPTSKGSTTQTGILFADDTNLWTGMGDEDDLLSATIEAQEGVDQWGGSLGANKT